MDKPPLTVQEDSRKIKELPPDERPREKLLRCGPAALTDSELVAILQMPSFSFY